VPQDDNLAAPRLKGSLIVSPQNREILFVIEIVTMSSRKYFTIAIIWICPDSNYWVGNKKSRLLVYVFYLFMCVVNVDMDTNAICIRSDIAPI